MSSPDRSGSSLRALARGNVGALALISLLNDTASEMIYPLLPVFLTGVLGAGPAALGVIEGVAEATASLMKLVGGFVSDRLGRRKLLIGWGYAVAALARPLVAVVVAPWQVLAVRFADRAGKGVRTAPRDALLAESVPEGRRGVAFGFHRAADHVGSVAGPLVAAALLVWVTEDVRVVFALALVPGLLSLGVLWRGVHERTPARGPAPPEKLRCPGAAAGDSPSLGRPFAVYVAIVAVFTLGNATDAFLLLRATDLGVPVAAVPLLWGLLHVSKAAWSLPGGALADRLGGKRVIVLGWIVYAAVYAAFAAASRSWHVWALFACYGLYFGLTESPEKALVDRFAPSASRGRAFGIFHGVVGFAALPASVLFGVVWHSYGARTAFHVGAGLALSAAIALALLVPDRPGPSST